MCNPDVDRLQSLKDVAVIVRELRLNESVMGIDFRFVEAHHPLGIAIKYFIGSSRKVEALYPVVVVIAKLKRCRGRYNRGFVYRDRKAVLAKAVRGGTRLGIDVKRDVGKYLIAFKILHSVTAR